MNNTSIQSSRSSQHQLRGTGLAGSLVRYLRGLLLTVLVGSLQAYKLLVSPLLGSRCRFYPSCSVYAQTSLQRFGVCKGGWLAVRRLLRCGPWGVGGIDNVPDHKDCCTPPTLQVAVNRTRA